MNRKQEQSAELRILYAETPSQPGERFVQVRRWETADGMSSELIVEVGHLSDGEELETRCQVVPFFMTVREALAAVEI